MAKELFCANQSAGEGRSLNGRSAFDDGARRGNQARPRIEFDSLALGIGTGKLREPSEGGFSSGLNRGSVRVVCFSLPTFPRESAKERFSCSAGTELTEGTRFYEAPAIRGRRFGHGFNERLFSSRTPCSSSCASAPVISEK